MAKIIPHDLIAHLEWVPGKEIPKNPIPPTPPGISNVGIQSNDFFWTISGVKYRGEIYTVDLLKELLERGATHTQSQWSDLYNNAQSTNSLYTPDFPLLYGVIKALHSAKDDATKAKEIVEAQEFIKQSSRNNWLMTLTRVNYAPRGLDKIIHNHGTTASYEEDVDFVGPDGWITSTPEEKAYQSLLGTKDSTAEINNVFNWLNGTNAYIYRVNSKPSANVERVAGFVADSSRALLYCGRDPTLTYPSLGVRAKKFGGSK